MPSCKIPDFETSARQTFRFLSHPRSLPSGDAARKDLLAGEGDDLGNDEQGSFLSELLGAGAGEDDDFTRELRSVFGEFNAAAAANNAQSGHPSGQMIGQSPLALTGG